MLTYYTPQIKNIFFLLQILCPGKGIPQNVLYVKESKKHQKRTTATT